MSEGIGQGMNPDGLDNVQEEIDSTVWEKDWEPSEGEEAGNKTPSSPENLEEAA